MNDLGVSIAFCLGHSLSKNTLTLKLSSRLHTIAYPLICNRLKNCPITAPLPEPQESDQGLKVF